MSKFSRIVVLVTALLAVLSSTAGAVTWTNSGGTTFHATGGAVSLTVTKPGGGGSLLTCTGSTATGTIASVFTTGTGTLTYSPCSIVGTQYELGCNYTMVPVLFTAGTPAVTTTSMSVTCTWRVAGSTTALCHIAGPTPAHYINPNGATPGQLTLTASNTLTISHSSGSTCAPWLGTFSSATLDLSENSLSLSGTPANHPVISRDA